MKYQLSKHAGFCGGVQRAYDIITKILNDPKVKKPVVILGSLVHNKDVVEKIEKLGAKKLHVTSDLNKMLDDIDYDIGTLAITAHGMGPEMYNIVRERNIDLIDTTCSKVSFVQKLAKQFSDADKFQLIIIGDKDHKEVKGIHEWSENLGTVIESINDIKSIHFDPSKKVIIIAQTTSNEEEVKNIVNEIQKLHTNVEFINTVCNATHSRQEDVKNLAKDNDVMLIIGSPDSANSKRLYSISKEINPNSYFIQNVNEIKDEWFGDKTSVGITAGASTPDWIIREVEALILNK